MDRGGKTRSLTKALTQKDWGGLFVAGSGKENSMCKRAVLPVPKIGGKEQLEPKCV